MNREQTHIKVNKALYSVSDDVDSEFLFGLTDEEFLYAAEKVEASSKTSGNNPVQLGMVLGACLARQKFLGTEATSETVEASKSAKG